MRVYSTCQHIPSFNEQQEQDNNIERSKSAVEEAELGYDKQSNGFHSSPFVGLHPSGLALSVACSN